jgi:hypothetical protein
MPKNPVTDPITDQEIAFAHLILSGTMNDRSAAEAVGLNPATAAYTKAKPRVRAYMAEHRAAVNQKLVDQQAEELIQFSIGRERILTRLWELATLSQEATRGSITAQIKALSMIIAIEGLIPDRRRARVYAQPVTSPAQPFNNSPNPHREQPSAGQHPGENVPKPPATGPLKESSVASAADPIPRPASAPAHVASLFAPAPTTPLNPFVHSVPANPTPVTLENAFNLHVRHYSELQIPQATRMAELLRRR